MRHLVLQTLSHALAAGLLAAALTAATTSPARAAGNRNAKIMLHALATTGKAPCPRTQNIPSTCAGYNAGVNNLALYPNVYYAYLLVVDGSLTEGVAGMQCGITYPGGFAPGGGNVPINVYGWTLCATLEFASPSPAWPNPGSGTLITWNATGPQCTAPPGNANIGAVGVAGFFYMAGYGPAQMRLTPRPVDGQAKVANCGSVEDVVYTSPFDSQTNLGAVGFGTTGINPCGRQEQEPPICYVSGPNEAIAGQTGIEYSTQSFGTIVWTITGNGTIDGPANQPTVLVDAGAPGTFTIRATVTRTEDNVSTYCEQIVTVHAPVPATPTSWGRIKSLTMGR